MITVNPLLNSLPLRSRGGKLLKKPLARLLQSLIGHFRVPPILCFKTRVGAQPLRWKSFFILRQIKFIFTRKVVHQPHFETERFWNSQVAYWDMIDCIILLNTIVTPLVDWSGKVYSRVGSSDLFLISWCIPSNFHELELFPLCHVGLYNTTPCLPLPSSLSSLPEKINGDESK